MLLCVLNWTDATPAAIIARPDAPAAIGRDHRGAGTASGYGFGA